MRKALLILTIMVTASLFNITVFAAVSNDEVTSIKLKEADGTSGQNTNSGSGVKTGHIQDGAVTTNKIADGAVTDAKVSGTISGSKLGAHTHNGNDLADGTVTAGKIATGSVTNIKIGEAINVNNLGSYANVKIVHKGLADGMNTFSTIQSAINWIAANDPASSSQSKLIFIMPGLYVENITVPSFIQLKGSGRRNTTIKGATADAAVVTFPDGYMGSTGMISDLRIQPAYAYFRAIEGYTQFLYLSDAEVSGEVHIMNACCYSSNIRADASYLMLVEEPRVNLYATHSYVEFYPLIADAPDHYLVSSAITPREFTPNTRISYCYSTGDPVAIPNKP